MMTKKKRNLKELALFLGISLIFGLLLTSLANSCEQEIVTETDLDGQDTAVSGTDIAAGTSGQDGTAGGGAASGTGGSTGAVLSGSIAAIGGKEWKLVELKTSTKSFKIDRKKLEADGYGDLFTFSINGERVSGRAAPNRYTAGFKTGDNNALTILAPASTLMASIYDPQGIREREYFDYLIRVKRWSLNQGKLELHTADGEGKEAVLIYVN
jgi:heat shock protein HslJ